MNSGVGFPDPRANSVSVIDTATNKVVATVPVGLSPAGVAITPDGKHVYVTNTSPNDVSVIATASNTVVATVAVGAGPVGVAITPETRLCHEWARQHCFGDRHGHQHGGGHGVGAGEFPFAVAITPDGKHAYVTNESSSTVSVIDTATNKVVATVPVGTNHNPFGVAITPDGKHAYVVNPFGSGVVSVIDTATNKVVATVPVGNSPEGVAVTPDGKHVYVANEFSSNVSVIDTSTNTVVGAPIPVGGSLPAGVGIVPPPPGTPFLAFNVGLQIDLDSAPNEGGFALESSFTLSSTAPGINPLTEAVTLQVGTFTTTIPPGSFKKIGGLSTFVGVINGVSLEITPTGTLRYAFLAAANEVSLAGTQNPVYVTLTIGGDSGATSVVATITP